MLTIIRCSSGTYGIPRKVLISLSGESGDHFLHVWDTLLPYIVK